MFVVSSLRRLRKYFMLLESGVPVGGRSQEAPAASDLRAIFLDRSLNPLVARVPVALRAARRHVRVRRVAAARAARRVDRRARRRAHRRPRFRGTRRRRPSRRAWSARGGRRRASSEQSEICVLFMNTTKMVIFGQSLRICFICGAVARGDRTPRRWELACVA